MLPKGWVWGTCATSTCGSPTSRGVVVLLLILMDRCRFEGSWAQGQSHISGVSTTPPGTFAGCGRMSHVFNAVITSIIIIT